MSLERKEEVNTSMYEGEKRQEKKTDRRMKIQKKLLLLFLSYEFQ